MTARIDNTPPARVDVSVEGGDAWRNRNDFSAVWTNPDEGDRAPITAANYQLCAGRTANCDAGTHEELNVSRLPVAVPARRRVDRCRSGDATPPGTKQRTTRRSRSHCATTPSRRSWPSRRRRRQIRRRSAVRVTDQVSGIADGADRDRPAAGSGVWHTLATQNDGNRLVARIDDAALPAGVYRAAGARARSGGQRSLDRPRGRRPADGDHAAARDAGDDVAARGSSARSGVEARRRASDRAAASGHVSASASVRRFSGRLYQRATAAPSPERLCKLLSRTGTEPEQLAEDPHD